MDFHTIIWNLILWILFLLFFILFFTIFFYMAFEFILGKDRMEKKRKKLIDISGKALKIIMIILLIGLFLSLVMAMFPLERIGFISYFFMQLLVLLFIFAIFFLIIFRLFKGGNIAETMMRSPTIGRTQNNSRVCQEPGCNRRLITGRKYCWEHRKPKNRDSGVSLFRKPGKSRKLWGSVRSDLLYPKKGSKPPRFF